MGQIVIAEFMDGPRSMASRAHATLYDPVWSMRARASAALADAGALIVRNRTDVDAAFLAAAPKLNVLGRLGVGLDNIDLVRVPSAGSR